MSEAEPINVTVAVDFNEAIMDRIRDVSPRLNVTQHKRDVPTHVWENTEVLYTVREFPQPEESPRLRWIQLHSAGMGHALRQRIVQAEDMIVTSASGIHATQIAHYCLMMMMAFNYKLPRMLEFQQKSVWPEKQYDIFNPVDMQQQTLGIVGYGSIGRELARLADAMGMTVLASKRDPRKPAENETDYTPDGTGDPDGSIPERIYPGEALATMAAECDYLVVTLPLTEATRASVDERVFKHMKSTAILINIGRGAVVDEKDLITALSREEIGGAALDVFEEEPLPTTSPLWQMDNVIISPHVSGNLQNYHEKAANLFIANLERYLENKSLYNQLDRDAGY